MRSALEKRTLTNCQAREISLVGYCDQHEQLALCRQVRSCQQIELPTIYFLAVHRQRLMSPTDASQWLLAVSRDREFATVTVDLPALNARLFFAEFR